MPSLRAALRPPLASLLVALLLAGCAAVGPDYHAPAAAVPAQWSAPLPHGGSVQKLEDWWQQFDDPVLARLQQAAESDSPTLAQAWGNIEIARATLATARSGAAPTVTGSASVTRSGQKGTSPVTTRSAGADASWELDLFGKVRRNVESADAALQARRNDWHDARVSLAAEVATDYVDYRACGLLVDTYEQELVSLKQTTQATESLVRAGLGASTDAALAQATEASTTSTLLDQRAQCEVLVKSLANLTGLEDAELRRLLASGQTALPTVPALAIDSVPAQVVRQRPDVASRERDLAAASANIGVARAALYPSVTLAGSIGVSATTGSPLGTWSFGPSLSLPLFDGGARRAAVDSARGSYEVAYAQWRATVRDAVTEVEKALVQLDTAGQRTTQAERATQEYRRYLTGAEAERRAGTISLLDFETARRQALSAQLDLVGLQRDRITGWIAVYKALGGGWDSAAPVTPPLSRAP
jgi:NodT family efflux transporter outer membrane factor (OMF) lipoprotein